MKFSPTRILPIFLLVCHGAAFTATCASTQTAQSGSNFSAGNGMQMIWVAPINGWVGKYLVTQEEYQKVTGTNPSYFKGPRHPVGMVTWYDALAYCAKLTERDHALGILPASFQYNLPTDAQYDIFVGNAGGVDDAAQLLNQQKPNLTADVGSTKANQYGLYDTRGLFWQWCLDDYNRETRTMNSGLEIVKKCYVFGRGGKIIRGGMVPHFTDVIPLCFRYGCPPELHFYIYGIRAVVTTAQKSK